MVDSIRKARPGGAGKRASDSKPMRKEPEDHQKIRDYKEDVRKAKAIIPLKTRQRAEKVADKRSGLDSP